MNVNQKLENELLQYLAEENYKAQNSQEITAGLQIHQRQLPRIQDIIQQLEQRGKIVIAHHGRISLKAKKTKQPFQVVEGRIRRLFSGKLLFIPSYQAAITLQTELKLSEDWTNSLPLSGHQSLDAMDGDLVLAQVRMAPKRDNRSRSPRANSSFANRPEVRVEKIVERKRGNWVGLYRQGGRFGCIQGDGTSCPPEVQLVERAPSDASLGMFVLVEAIRYPIGEMTATGRIVEVIGWPEDEGVDMRAIIHKHSLRDRFPQEVIDECAKLQSPDEKPSAEQLAELERREDWRDRCVITIDPKTARDFDDAVNVLKLAEGWELAVHIADVSHYVQPNSALEREALKRGNSTYLPDRVLPMLPPRLCDDICSLKEGVERRTMLCRMQINDQGSIISARFSLARICSRKRLSYEDAFEVMEGRGSTGDEEVDNMILEGKQLARVLRARRFELGAIDLDMPSIRIVLDDKGIPQDVELEQSDEAHTMIEEFMLAANESAAGTLREKLIPSLYRVHEDPKPHKLSEFSALARQYGIKCGLINSYAELRFVTQAIKGKPDEMLLKLSLLRSLMRARYSPDSLGHFGLAKGDYCHFTSPIRRYADLIVHRGLRRLCSPLNELNSLPPNSELNRISDHISDTERDSSRAESEGRQLKLMQFLVMQTELDKPREWEAIVTACFPQGLAVEIPLLQVKGWLHESELSRSTSSRWYYERHVQRWDCVDGRDLLPGKRLMVIPVRVDTQSGIVDFAPTKIV